ncbi:MULTISPECIES: ABC transporter ATP-binding protein [Fusobacterium]|uniref:ABC transporter ATP-binding protein n=1 Tax=Fusobacterium TaxID=848 RepID=UPI001476B41F|nr:MULTISPECIES: ATP-binding cassette domain-containing protein [Fusobacterium]NME36642.1 ABC transporter ATP-binding protein [Fusobacterium sp. FSA-380-WT-3A]
MLLEIKNLNKFYDDKHILKDVSFHIEEGEVYGLVGESGCGKSTTARVLTGLTSIKSGEIIFEGKKIDYKKIRGVRDIQMVFQDPNSSLNPMKDIKWILEEPFKINKCKDKKLMESKIKEMLQMANLNEDVLVKYPGELSGGQKQRIAIILALLSNPKLLIADEAVSSLDLSGQASILNFFKKLQKDLKLSYLFISHDLRVVYHMCDRIGVMRNGEIVEEGTPEEIYLNPKHDYTKALLKALPGSSDFEEALNNI